MLAYGCLPGKTAWLRDQEAIIFHVMFPSEIIHLPDQSSYRNRGLYVKQFNSEITSKFSSSSTFLSLIMKLLEMLNLELQFAMQNCKEKSL